VFVNGRLAVENERPLGTLSGQLIVRPQAQERMKDEGETSAQDRN
jgi:hypothetical protein